MGAVAVGSFLLLLVVAYLIVRPFIAPEIEQPEVDGSEELLEEKEKLLEEIRELDMDFATGKLTEDDYRRLRARSVAEAAAAIQAVGELADREAEHTGEDVGPVTGVDDSAGDGRVSSEVEDEIERDIAARRDALRERACPKCGAIRGEPDRFCRLCGAALTTIGAR